MSPLKDLKSGLLSRSLRIAGMVTSASKTAVKVKLMAKNQWGASKQEILDRLLADQMQMIVGHFNQMKGAAMKIGQMASMYGEVFLPPEVNEVLKSLQTRSTPMEWSVIEAVLLEELGPLLLNELEIEPTPIASASIGQVHRARIRASGREVVIKVQYPGVDRAIENDLKILRSLFQFIELLPQVSHLPLLFDEIQAMLHQELDYRKECELAMEYAEVLKNDSRYIVPAVHKKYCRQRVLVMDYVPGVAIDSDVVKDLPPERRDRLGVLFLELYFKELFQWGMVQTDPHFGNYRIRLETSDGNGPAQDQFVLFDFGAVRRLPQQFVEKYKELVMGALRQDEAQIVNAAYKLDFLRESDPQELKDSFVKFCITMVEPFSDQGSDLEGRYEWGKSDIPKRLTQQVGQVIKNFKFRAPPQEVVFLDRKTGGVFIVLSSLRARVKGRALIENFLPLLKIDSLK